MKTLAELIEPYTGKWVVLTSDESTVIGVCDDMDEALNLAKKQKDQSPFLIKSPDSYTSAFFY